MVDFRRARQQVQYYTGKVGDARYPHPSHWGRVCFLSTPDGEKSGCHWTYSIPNSRRQVLKYAWAKGCSRFFEVSREFPFHNTENFPDVVINSHAFPSRQTPSQLLEAALVKGIACGGLKKYATPFSTPSFDAITEQLHRAGFSISGMERVYNGRTGKMVRSLIFMGPTFYQCLVHMAKDKVKFRNTGPVHPLTRQPVADKKRFGGIKFGEMERDCLMAHGASVNLHERLFTLSDSSQVHVCRKCKNVASVIQRSVGNGRKVRGPYCYLCETEGDIVKVAVPYGVKLLCQELFSMGICLKFETELC